MELVIIVLVLVAAVVGSLYFLVQKKDKKEPTTATGEEGKPTATITECPTGQVHCPWPLDDQKYCCNKSQYEALVNEYRNLGQKGACDLPDKQTCLLSNSSPCCTQDEFNKETEELVEMFKQIRSKKDIEIMIENAINTSPETNNIKFLESVVHKLKNSSTCNPDYFTKKRESVLPPCSINASYFEKIKPMIENIKAREGIPSNVGGVSSVLRIDRALETGQKQTVINEIQYQINYEKSKLPQIKEKVKQDEVLSSTPTPKRYSGSGTSDDPWIVQKPLVCENLPIRCDYAVIPGGSRTIEHFIDRYKNDTVITNQLQEAKKYLEYPRFKNKIERDKYFCKTNGCDIPPDYFYGVTKYQY